MSADTGHELNKGEMKELDVPLVFVLGIASMFILVATVLLGQAYVYYNEWVETERFNRSEFSEVSSIYEEQRRRLENYNYDAERKAIVIPASVGIAEYVKSLSSE